MSNLCVRDVMTADVQVLQPEDPLNALQDLMGARHVRHVPVVSENGSLVGLVSERDLLRRALGSDAEVPLSLRADLMSTVTVRDIMTWELETIEPDEAAAVAAQIMLDNKYGCLPVAANELHEQEPLLGEVPTRLMRSGIEPLTRLASSSRHGTGRTPDTSPAGR